jgi:ribosomal 50S subunit-recycling heat shock protein
MTRRSKDVLFEVELELTIDEKDGSIVVQKMSELATKAKELGFAIVEAEVEREEEEEGEEVNEG